MTYIIKIGYQRKESVVVTEYESKPQQNNEPRSSHRDSRSVISWGQSRERDNFNANNEEFASEPANFDYYAQPYGGEAPPFDVMFKQFKKDSDENLLDLKRSIENKRGGPTNKRQ